MAACWWSAGKPLAKGTDLVERVEQSLGDKFAGVYDGVRAGSPLTTVEQGVEMATRTGADLLVALGGGSAVVTTQGDCNSCWRKVGVPRTTPPSIRRENRRSARG